MNHFGFVSSERNLNYDCVVTYSIPVHNSHAKQIQVYEDPEQKIILLHVNRIKAK